MAPGPGSLLLIGAAVTLSVAAGWIFHRLRVSPAERERRRRLLVNRTGRITDGLVTDIEDDVLYYSYSVSGVDYIASQDISALRSVLPEDRDGLIGPVVLKYSPGSPGNSIVACEEWSGLRSRHQTHSQLKKELETT